LELSYIRIGFRSILPWFPRNNIDREKGTWFAFQDLLIPFNKIVNLWAMLAIANACANNDLVEQIKVRIRRIVNGNQVYPVGLLLNDPLQSLADF
jgi:hypothetical protein